MLRGRIILFLPGEERGHRKSGHKGVEARPMRVAKPLWRPRRVRPPRPLLVPLHRRGRGGRRRGGTVDCCICIDGGHLAPPFALFLEENQVDVVRLGARFVVGTVTMVGVRITDGDGDAGSGGGVDCGDGTVLILDRILWFVLWEGDAQVRKPAGGFVEILNLPK